MSDETTGAGPGADERDERDPGLAALLAVEPLDQVTRRRLVRTAVASAPPRRPRLALIAPVAAAVAIGVVVGAVVVTRPDDTVPTALGTSSTVAAAPAPRANAPTPGAAASAPSAESSSVAVAALGDLGNVTDPAALRRSIRRARSKVATGSPKALPAGPCAATSPDSIGIVAASSAGTGTLRGTRVVVVVGVDPSGSELGVVLRADTCAEVERVTLTGS